VCISAEVSAGDDDQSTFRAELKVADDSAFVAYYFAQFRPLPGSRGLHGQAA
jgi:hypothetical protein